MHIMINKIKQLVIALKEARYDTELTLENEIEYGDEDNISKVRERLALIDKAIKDGEEEYAE